MTVTPETIGEWLDVAYKISMFIFGVWLYLERRNDKTLVRITKIEEKFDDRADEHAERLVKVESKLNNQPTHDHLAEVYKEIRKVSEGMVAISSSYAALHATLEGVDKMVQRMDTFWRTADRRT